MPDATYTPTGGSPYAFGLLVEVPGRTTEQAYSERIIPGTTDSEVDNLYPHATKITGKARIDGFPALQTFEGAVGTTGVLVYGEDSFDIIWVALDRTQVVKNDIHICDVELWIVDGLCLVRTLSLSIYNDTTAADITRALRATCNYGFDQRASQGVFATMLGTGISHDDQITITMGVVGDNVVARLTGVVREIESNASPMETQVTIYGSLQLAIEYENWEDPTAIGGIIVSDLTGLAEDSSSNVIQAVLTKASVPFTPANIDGSTVLYGFYEDAFVWKNGENSENFDLRETGETAMSYIERFDEIDSVFSAGLGGRYRTFNTVGTPPDDVYRILAGGRPRGVNDFVLTEGARNVSGVVDVTSGSTTVTGTGTDFGAEVIVGQYIIVGNTAPDGTKFLGQLAEGRVVTSVGGGSLGVDRAFGITATGVQWTVGDILDGHYDDGITQTRNYFVVSGYDDGSGAGPFSFQLTDSNAIQGDSSTGPKHTFRLSSQMIERDLDSAPGNGISCETVANAVSLDYNRAIRSGSLSTYRDDIFGIGQTHLLQALGGLPGRLGVGQKMWDRSLEITIDEQGLTQRLGHLGGGLPDPSLPAPP